MDNNKNDSEAGNIRTYIHTYTHISIEQGGDGNFIEDNKNDSEAGNHSCDAVASKPSRTGSDANSHSHSSKVLVSKCVRTYNIIYIYIYIYIYIRIILNMCI
jgi:hypothetical protein